MTAPLHHFASKKEPKISLAWLDDNFEQALGLTDGLTARLEAQGKAMAEQAAEILALKDQIAKLGSIETIAQRVNALQSATALPKKPVRKKK